MPALVASLVLLAGADAATAAPLRFHVEPLALPAGIALRTVRAVSINEQGAMAGWYLDEKFGNKHPIRWSAAGVPTADTTFGDVVAVNDAGQFVYRIPGEGAYLLKDGLSTPLVHSNPAALNNAGVVTGSYSADFRHSTTYVEDASGAHDIAALGSSAYPAALNDLGHVVGTSSLPGSSRSTNVFLWRDGVAKDLGRGAAADVNNHDVVVYSHTGKGDAPLVTGYVWREGAKRRAIPPLAGQAITEPAAINDKGWVVGYASNWDAAAPAWGFLYVKGATCALDAMLDDASKAAGWHIDQAFDVNEQGVIVAQAIVNGKPVGVKLVPSGQDFGC